MSRYPKSKSEIIRLGEILQDFFESKLVENQVTGEDEWEIGYYDNGYSIIFKYNYDIDEDYRSAIKEEFNSRGYEAHNVNNLTNNRDWILKVHYRDASDVITEIISKAEK